MQTIYLDHHATTPLDPRVLEAMMPTFREAYGNAGSRFHPFGLDARNRMEVAREQTASLLGCEAAEIIFTSGATEANNLAIFGTAEARRERGRHLITCVTEHHAVVDPMMELKRRGFEVTFLPVSREGFLDLDRLRRAFRPETTLVSLMAGNNETGVLHPVAEIGALCRDRGVTFHCDAVQVAGKIPIDVEAWQVDLLTLSAHKFHGPKGVGALYLRRRKPRAHLEPIVLGGGQELGLRSGTHNVPGIVGLGEAARLAKAEMPERVASQRALRDRLWTVLQQGIPDLALNGPADFSRRLPNNLNVEFRCCEAQSILMEAGHAVACSPGSACTSDNTEPSYVLLAMGLTREEAISSLRFGVSHTNTAEEIERVPSLLLPAVERLRAMSPWWRAGAGAVAR